MICFFYSSAKGSKRFSETYNASLSRTEDMHFGEQLHNLLEPSLEIRAFPTGIFFSSLASSIPPHVIPAHHHHRHSRML
jgi:hypothetical protein